MEGLKVIPYVVLIIGVSAVILGALSISTGTMGDTLTTRCINSSYVYNTTLNICRCETFLCNLSRTGTNGLNYSDSYYALYEGGNSLTTVGSQFPTIAIVGVMTVIIGLIASVFAYFRWFA